MPGKANRLAKEGSPYLQQHACNPVDWFPWGDEAFEKAREENKLMLISVGYSSCHWCHVMEQESFESEETAAVMNRYFVCVKVDREERPDVDQVYMNALQLMSGQGGWPLNIFVLPDGRPVYGGTYFPNEKWKSVLFHLEAIWRDETQKVFDYADKLTQGVALSDKIIADEHAEISVAVLKEAVVKWKSRFDTIEGGPNYAPKFPLPNNYLFLLRYALQENDPVVLSQVKLTLDKMALGGIYDQLGGGFSRYSTDMIWKVPHFEKMLYDNAQLIALYAEAYRHFESDLYRQIVEETISFCQQYWGNDGGFFSAMDADSDGVEGKYYVWTQQELKQILGEEYDWFADYYSVHQLGHWEDDSYILLRRHDDSEFARQINVPLAEFRSRVKNAKEKLLHIREKRTLPLIDDKQICSWNAMMLRGLCEAGRSFGGVYNSMAVNCGHFILRNLLKSDGGLYHIFQKGKAKINGFLEDYAFSIEAFISLFEISGEKIWLDYALQWTDYVIRHFSDDQSPLFFFTSDEDAALIVRKTEFADNVTPAPNSVMAKCLFLLAHITDRTDYELKAESMLKSMTSQYLSYPAGFSNWMMLHLWKTHPFYELAICGPDAKGLAEVFFAGSTKPVIVAFSDTESDIPLLKNRFIKEQTLLYLCRNKSCNLPVSTLEEIFALLE